MEAKKVNDELILVNFRGMIMPMTPEKFEEFKENLNDEGWTK